MNIRPLADRVVLKRMEAEETTKGGIVLTSTAKELPQVAEVLAVGPGTEEHKMEVEVGDKVTVKFLGFDEKGRINLSRKDALADIEAKKNN